MLTVDPYAIDFDALPFLSLKDKKHLPAIACVYLVSTPEREIEYIGATQNLKNRFSSHSRAKDFAEHCHVQWVPVENARDRDELECFLIYLHRPRINVVGIKRSHPAERVLVPVLMQQVLVDFDSDRHVFSEEYYLYG